MFELSQVVLFLKQLVINDTMFEDKINEAGILLEEIVNSNSINENFYFDSTSMYETKPIIIESLDKISKLTNQITPKMLTDDPKLKEKLISYELNILRDELSPLINESISGVNQEAFDKLVEILKNRITQTIGNVYTTNNPMGSILKTVLLSKFDSSMNFITSKLSSNKKLLSHPLLKGV